MENKKISVKNRGTGSVVYSIPDLGIRRDYAPGETKRGIDSIEMEKLSFMPGGQKLIKKYLLISDKDIAEELDCTDPEYFYDEDQIKYLLTSGSLEQFLDCLDFGPTGVIDLVKKLSVEIKLNDVSKREAIKKIFNFDVSKAIENVEYDKSGVENDETTKTRRAEAVTEVPVPITPIRRYNVVKSDK